MEYMDCNICYNHLILRKNMNFTLLSQAPLFSGLKTEEIKNILSRIPHRIRNFKSGNLIAQNNEVVDKLMVVIDGVVKGEMVDYSGRVIKIEDIPAPGALAPAFIFGKINRFPVNVVAVTDTELFIVNKIDFLNLLISSDTVLINFLDMISNRSQFLSEKIKFLNFKTIKGKLAHYILQKAGKQNMRVNLNVTQNDLADFFGVARPSVSRALRDLKEEGFIRVRGKEIEILNEKGLGDLTIG